MLKNNETVEVKLYGKKYAHEGINIIKVKVKDIETVYKFS
jgi:hypothetical protein